MKAQLPSYAVSWDTAGKGREYKRALHKARRARAKAILAGATHPHSHLETLESGCNWKGH